MLVRRYLDSPVVHSVDTAQSPVSSMTHHVLHVDHNGRLDVVTDLAAAPGRTVLFTRTKRGAKVLARQLNQRGVPAVELHGNLSQGARTRALDAFSSGKATTLVATDIAARGIHVDDVGLVVHADRRRSTRPTCTAPGVRRAPAPRGRSSRSWSTVSRPTYAT